MTDEQAKKLAEIVSKEFWQGATVYCADRNVQFPIPIFLNKDFMIKGKELSHKENCVKDNILLEDLYETHEQAEARLKWAQDDNKE